MDLAALMESSGEPRETIERVLLVGEISEVKALVEKVDWPADPGWSASR
jgi:hypothetical protein